MLSLLCATMLLVTSLLICCNGGFSKRETVTSTTPATSRNMSSISSPSSEIFMPIKPTTTTTTLSPSLLSLSSSTSISSLSLSSSTATPSESPTSNVISSTSTTSSHNNDDCKFCDSSELTHSIFFGSFIFWCFLLVFEAYTAYEHFVRSRYRQMALIFFLLLSASFRLAFFFLASSESSPSATLPGNIRVSELFNRLSLLTQSTALSILFYLWFNFMLLHVKGDSSSSSSSSHHTDRTTRDSVNMRMMYIKKVRYFFMTLNFLLYIAVLSTLGDKRSRDIYTINVAFVCIVELLQVVFLLIMGTMMGLLIIEEAIRITSDEATTRRFEQLPYIKKLSYLYKMAFVESFEGSFYISERIIINSLLSMSLWLLLIFTIRSTVSIVALIQFQVLNAGNGPPSFQVYNSIVYPWFFYQIPDGLTFFILAFNIAPSNGIFYRYIKPCITKLYCCLPFWNNPRVILASQFKNANIGDNEYDIDDKDHLFADFESQSQETGISSNKSSTITLTDRSSGVPGGSVSGSGIRTSIVREKHEEFSKTSTQRQPDFLKVQLIAAENA